MPVGQGNRNLIEFKNVAEGYVFKLLQICRQNLEKRTGKSFKCELHNLGPQHDFLAKYFIILLAYFFLIALKK